jgi:hypothetical protein
MSQYFISGKFKSIFIDVKLKLTNVNQVLIDFKVIYEILTKDYSKFLVNFVTCWAMDHPYLPSGTWR